MNRQRIAIFSLIIFVQAVMYPAIVFALYTETDNFEFGSETSLPVDFPDNGDAYYFGFSNSEEEHSEQHGMQSDDCNLRYKDDALVADSEPRIVSNFLALSLHVENCTPPPERK